MQVTRQIFGLIMQEIFNCFKTKYDFDMPNQSLSSMHKLNKTFENNS